MNITKYQKITFTIRTYNKRLQLIFVLVIYKSTIVPVQPLVCPVIHYGNPRFQIPQQYCQKPLCPNRQIGQDSSDGNTCNTGGEG